MKKLVFVFFSILFSITVANAENAVFKFKMGREVITKGGISAKNGNYDVTITVSSNGLTVESRCGDTTLKVNGKQWNYLPMLQSLSLNDKKNDSNYISLVNEDGIIGMVTGNLQLTYKDPVSLIDFHKEFKRLYDYLQKKTTIKTISL